MQISPINQAIPLKMESKCSICCKHYSDLLFERNELFITDCGHIFDKICIKKLIDQSPKNPLCSCGKTIRKTAHYCSNIWGDCTFNSDIHTKLPSSLNQSLHNELQILITNCGHLVHAVCWLELRELDKEEFKFGRCHECKQPITELALFQVIPIYHKEWAAKEEDFRKRQTELLLKDFVRNDTPTPPPAQKTKSIPKATSQLNMDGFEML